MRESLREEKLGNVRRSRNLQPATKEVKVAYVPVVMNKSLTHIFLGFSCTMYLFNW